ncbi:MerC domain-containing protein [Paracoccaceae bacterium Fryx2]|nr:MerC domain-containing protein [Paracoccaceae bacterium Fryx2]
MKAVKPGDWLAPLAAALSLVACYGTLAAIGLLGVLGVTIALNETVWAGAILLFAGLTFALLLVRLRRHGRLAPVALAGIGLLLIGFTMLVSYDRIIELAGFGFLCAGTIMDWRSRREPVHGDR